MKLKKGSTGQTARTIGLFSSTAIIVGFVVGVSVFVLPGAIAGSVGPAVLVVYAGASLLGLLACVVGAQLGCAYPTNAASFVAVSELLGEVWGFLLVWIIIGASAVGVGLLAHGLADYMQTFVSVDGMPIAVLAVIFSALTNLFGARAGASLQTLLVAAFLTVLLIFISVGLPEIRPELLSPFAPNGWRPVLTAVVPAYFSYAGFFVIIELAGEVKDPQKTIPRAMLVSFVAVLLTYLLVCLVLVGLLPWQKLGDDSAPIVSASAEVLPSVFLTLLAVTAVAAGASSINGILLGYSRDLRALADRRLIPRWTLFHTDSMADESAGVLTIAALALCAVSFSESVTALATQAVLGTLAVQVLLGLALLKWQRSPAMGEGGNSRTVLFSRVGAFSSIALIVFSLGAIFMFSLGQPEQLLIMASYVVMGGLFYRFRHRPHS